MGKKESKTCPIATTALGHGFKLVAAMLLTARSVSSPAVSCVCVSYTEI